MYRPKPENRSKASPLKLALPVLALNLAACCMVAPHHAQAEPPAASPMAPMASAPASPAVAEAPAPGLITTEGMISMVEADGTVIIMAAQGKNTVVYVRPETKVTRNGLPATIRDLKAGDRATARHGAGGGAAELSAQGK